MFERHVLDLIKMQKFDRILFYWVVMSIALQKCYLTVF